MAQPSTDSMTSNPACFYSACGDAPKWAVTSMAQTKQPDGKPLLLYTCDNHYGTLTNNLRNAGTKYVLAPINGPHMVPPIDEAPATPEEALENKFKGRSIIFKAFVYPMITIVMVLIGPFMLVYYGCKWLLGWRPGKGK